MPYRGLAPFRRADPAPLDEKTILDVLQFAQEHRDIVAMARINTREDAIAYLTRETPAAIWINDLYQVDDFGYQPCGEHWPQMRHLSVMRLDRGPIRDWRHLQCIKNQICGSQCEAVELYPADARLVDGANQYHLWVLPHGRHFPFGFASRSVSERAIGDAMQRPFDEIEPTG